MMVPAGNGAHVGYARDSGTVRLMGPGTSALLTAAFPFRTLEQHAAALAHGSGMHGKAVRHELDRLAQEGFLVTIPTVSSSQGPIPPVTILAVPTKDRPHRLASTAASYVENANAAGRMPELLVSDDSTDRRATLRQLRAVRAPARYAGPTEKRRYVRLLADRAGVPRGIAALACCGDGAMGLATVGANRNAILLDTAGDRLVMTDDDVVCRVARPAGASDGPVRLTSQGGPLEVALFADRDDALAATLPVDDDILAVHERWLGRPVLELLGADPDADDASPSTLRRITGDGASIAVTLTGLVGDCAWDSAAFALFLPRSSGRARTREAVQAAVSPTLTDRGDPMFGWCLGLDNRTLLPPFTPFGRAEDVAFGVLLSECFPGRFLAHLPHVLLHDPAGVRDFSDEPPFSIGFNSWLPSVLSGIVTGPGTPERRLTEVGGYLRELGSASPAAFADFARMHLLDSLAARTQLLEDRMPEAPPSWRRDARAEIEGMRAAALAEDHRLHTQPGGQEATQARLVRFGELLVAWPALWEAARELRASGVRMTVGLGDVGQARDRAVVRP